MALQTVQRMRSGRDGQCMCESTIKRGMLHRYISQFQTLVLGENPEFDPLENDFRGGIIDIIYSQPLTTHKRRR